MKRISLYGIFFSVLVQSYAQTSEWKWARSAKATYGAEGFCIAADTSENLYVSGLYFGGSTSFDTVVLTSANRKAFIAKYDRNGNLKWAKGPKGIGEAFGLSVACDLPGNSYITGWITDTVYFDSFKLDPINN